MLAELICASVLTIGMPNAKTACKYMKHLVIQAEKYEIDPVLMVALIHTESRWKPKAKSKSGACGLTQVIPKYSKYSCKQLKHPRRSIRVGTKILRRWITVYGEGDISLGLCGYNAGYKCGKKYPNSRRRKYGVGYAKEVIKMYEKIDLQVEILEEENGLTSGDYSEPLFLR